MNSVWSVALLLMLSLLPSAALLAAVYFFYPHIGALSSEAFLVVKYLPILSTLAVLLLGLRAGHSGLFFAALNLLLLYVLLTWLTPLLSAARANGLHALLCWLAPGNLLLFSLLDECALITRRGGGRLLALLLPLIVGAVLVWLSGDSFSALLHYRLGPKLAPFWFDYPPSAFLLTLVALLVTGGLSLLRPGIRHGALFSGLLAVVGMLQFANFLFITSLLANVALFMFVVASLPAAWRRGGGRRALW